MIRAYTTALVIETMRPIPQFYRQAREQGLPKPLAFYMAAIFGFARRM